MSTLSLSCGHSSASSDLGALAIQFSKLNFVPYEQDTEPEPKSHEQSESRGKTRLVLKATVSLLEVYKTCRSDFRYQTSLNPKRCLTKPSEIEGDGYDNRDADLVIYVNDEFVSSTSGRKYVVIDKLGQGTFGQVVKCVGENDEHFAVKIVRNKPAYTNQALVENMILSIINQDNSNHIVKYYECFTHKNHLCLVTELLSVNLYELLRQNQFRGLSMNLIRVILRQCLDALSKLTERDIVHCDLKPENIMLKAMTSPQIKVIDFGSACFVNQAVYTYIQSRFYRSPEVLLRLPYSSGIDMWSLGCIGVELFLGLPLWPGTSEYNQMCKIVESLGMPPKEMLDRGKWTDRFFNRFTDEQGRMTYALKTPQQFQDENDCELPKDRNYFKFKRIQELIEHYPFKKGLTPDEVEKEKLIREKFAHFLQGVLVYDTYSRWTAKECLQHPFFSNQDYDPSWKPDRSEESGTLPQMISHPHGNMRARAREAYSLHGFCVHGYPLHIHGDGASWPGIPPMHAGEWCNCSKGYGETFGRTSSLLQASPGGTMYPPWAPASIGQQRGLPMHSPGSAAFNPGSSPGVAGFWMAQGMGMLGMASNKGGAGMNKSPYGSPTDNSLLAAFYHQHGVGSHPHASSWNGGGWNAQPASRPPHQHVEAPGSGAHWNHTGGHQEDGPRSPNHLPRASQARRRKHDRRSKGRKEAGSAHPQSSIEGEQEEIVREHGFHVKNHLHTTRTPSSDTKHNEGHQISQHASYFDDSCGSSVTDSPPSPTPLQLDHGCVFSMDEAT